MTFLIIEDDHEIVNIIENILTNMGHHCLSAATTREADLALATVHIEAMTLDLGIPGPDSIRWLEEIALVRPELTENTLVISGSDPEANVKARIARTGASLLLKPFTSRELLKCFDVRLIERERDRPYNGTQVPTPSSAPPILESDDA